MSEEKLLGLKYTLDDFVPTNGEISEAGTGAVRSGDSAKERWDLISYRALDELLVGMREFSDWHLKSHELISLAIDHTGRFLGGESVDSLRRGFQYLSVAIQKIDTNPQQFNAWVGLVESYRELESVGVVTNFMFAPYHALRRMSMTYHEGATKYGMHNWLNGFPISDLANHRQKHLAKYLNAMSDDGWLPDTKEDDLGHASWGDVAMMHMLLYRPDMCKYRLDPNYTLTDEIRETFPFKSREPMKSHEAPLTELFPKVLSDAIDIARGGPAPVAARRYG